MNMVDALDRAERFTPDRDALIFGDTRLNYAAFASLVRRAGAGLKELGVKKGDRVCLFLHNCHEFMIAHYAVMKIGAVCVSLSPMLKADEVKSLVNDSKASVLFTEQSLWGSVPEKTSMTTLTHIVGLGGLTADIGWPEFLVENADDLATEVMEVRDPATIIYTSGTSGESKGVVLCHGNLVSNTNAAKYMCNMRGEDRSLVFLPMSHSFAQNFIANSVVQSGSTLVIMKAFEPEEALKLLTKEKITRFYAVPPIYIMMLNNPAAKEAMSTVRYLFSAAASMPGEVARRCKETFGIDINEGYGLTETTPFSTYNHEFRHKVGSVGTPVMNVEVRIVDPEGVVLPEGEMGEIEIRGPNVMNGYFGKPEETAKAMDGDWLRTGDVGYLDDEGYLFLADRIKDMINNAGLKVWPRQVEEILYTHPEVVECAVIGVPHEVFGETVKAVVVTRNEACVTGDELCELVRSKLADYKVPRIVEFVEALPKNSTGKILKRELRTTCS